MVEIPPALEVSGLGVTYGSGEAEVVALQDVSFSVGAGELCCIVGPSGCGKTTLLRSIAGLMTPTTGRVRVNGNLVNGVADGLALVFQDYSRSLFPWKTVEQNIELPLKARKISRDERIVRASAALAEVGLDGFQEKYPWQLSGGMQQRVAIARALAFRPSVLLMDEPFASVDAQTRADLEDLVLKVQEDTDVTVLFVTHDIDESVYLGSRVIALSSRPTVVRRELPIELPYPRHQIRTKATPEFVSLRSQVMDLIQREKEPA